MRLQIVVSVSGRQHAAMPLAEAEWDPGSVGAQGNHDLVPRSTGTQRFAVNGERRGGLACGARAHRGDYFATSDSAASRTAANASVHNT